MLRFLNKNDDSVMMCFNFPASVLHSSDSIICQDIFWVLNNNCTAYDVHIKITRQRQGHIWSVRLCCLLRRTISISDWDCLNLFIVWEPQYFSNSLLYNVCSARNDVSFKYNQSTLFYIEVCSHYFINFIDLRGQNIKKTLLKDCLIPGI